MAKNSLEKYTHYYERWASNQSVSIFLPNSVSMLRYDLIFSLSLSVSTVSQFSLVSNLFCFHCYFPEQKEYLPLKSIVL